MSEEAYWSEHRALYGVGYDEDGQPEEHWSDFICGRCKEQSLESERGPNGLCVNCQPVALLMDKPEVKQNLPDDGKTSSAPDRNYSSREANGSGAETLFDSPVSLRSATKADVDPGPSATEQVFKEPIGLEAILKHLSERNAPCRMN